MTLWMHTGNGHWIGSCFMCFAETEDEAARLIREALDAGGLQREKLNLSSIRSDVPGVFHADNGDY